MSLYAECYILDRFVTVGLDNGFHCGSVRYQSVMQQKKRGKKSSVLPGSYWQNLLAFVDNVRATLNPAYSIISSFNTFSLSCWIVGATNIWIEMTSMLREHFICLVSVLHGLRDGDMSETSTLIPKGAKENLAYSQCSLHMCQLSGCQSKYFTQRLFPFCLTLIPFFFFLFSSTTVLWCAWVAFPLTVRSSFYEVPGKPGPLPVSSVFLGQPEGHLTF